MLVLGAFGSRASASAAREFLAEELGAKYEASLEVYTWTREGKLRVLSIKREKAAWELRVELVAA